MPKNKCECHNDINELYKKIHRFEEILLMSDKFSEIIKIYDEKIFVINLLYGDTKGIMPIKTKEVLEKRLLELNDKFSKL